LLRHYIPRNDRKLPLPQRVKSNKKDAHRNGRLFIVLKLLILAPTYYEMRSIEERALHHLVQGDTFPGKGKQKKRLTTLFFSLSS